MITTTMQAIKSLQESRRTTHLSDMPVWKSIVLSNAMSCSTEQGQKASDIHA